ncbi:MarR family winged helix-turn-helix transcriptional regulator [Methanobrevibacter sp.]|uniref:MarR family winged helix-turn-helix transcriptional regulator n=1 Tax=Methanobrevibacter sp. TaxID=66852 RepID=UPI00388FD402
MVDLNSDDDKFEDMPVFYFINYINVIHDNFLKENFKDIAPRDFTYLSNIYFHKNISQKELAGLLYVSEANVAQIIKRLEKNGVVKRTIVKDNKSKKILSLTDKGESAFNSLLNLIVDFESQLFKDYSAEEKENFRKMIRDYYEKAMEY